eukprot:6212734-Pleurochrysis_carterae.AAC.3
MPRVHLRERERVHFRVHLPRAHVRVRVHVRERGAVASTCRIMEECVVAVHVVQLQDEKDRYSAYNAAHLHAASRTKGTEL